MAAEFRPGTKPGHGLDELMAALDALDGRTVHVTRHVTQYRRDSDGVGMTSGGSSLRDLARAVSRELARMEDEEN